MIAIITLLVVFASTILLSYKNEQFRNYIKAQIDQLLVKCDGFLKSNDSHEKGIEAMNAVTSMLPSLTMREDEVIQQLPDPIRKVIMGVSTAADAVESKTQTTATAPTATTTTTTTTTATTTTATTTTTAQQKVPPKRQQQQTTQQQVQEREEDEELLKDLSPAVQIGLSKSSSVRNLISRFEQSPSTTQSKYQPKHGVSVMPTKPAVPPKPIKPDQKPVQPISTTPAKEEPKFVVPPEPERRPLRDIVREFIENDEDYVLHLGRILPDCYQKPIQQFRKTHDTDGTNQHNYELLEILFNKLAKQMAADPSHLSLYNLKKMIDTNTSSTKPLSHDIKFLNAMSEIVMQFVKESLCKQYVPYVREYIAIRPKIQLLLNEKDKALQTYIRNELDKSAEAIQKKDSTFIKVLSLEEMIAEPCKRLTIYLTTFRDEWLPYVKEAELSTKFAKTSEEQEMSRQAAVRLENACSKLEREMKDNFTALEKAFQMNKIYAIQKRLNMDSLATETTDILGSSSAQKRAQKRSNNNDIVVTDRISSIPNFIYESMDESELIYRLNKGGKRKNDYPCEAYLLENMFILSWINTKENNKRENKIYYLKGVSVESLGDRMFMLTIMGQQKLFECKEKRGRQRWFGCLRSVSDTGFFSTETSRKLAEHIRQNSASFDSPQDYYSIPLDTIRAKPQLYSCFEKGDEYLILYEKTENPVAGHKRNIRGASLEKLVQILTSPDKFDNSFLHSFMMTYQSFTSSEELIELLINRYNMPPSKAVENDKNAFARFKENCLFPIRIRICQVVKHWIQHHSYVFRNDPRARNKLSQFIEQHVAKTKLFTLADELRDDLYKSTQKRDTFTEQQLRMLSQKVHDLQLTRTSKQKSIPTVSPSGIEAPKPILPRKSPIKTLTKGKSSSVMDWSSVEIARQLTLIEFALFENIQVKECLNENWTKKDMAPNLTAMIQRSNLVVFFVAHEILKQQSVNSRVHAIQKWIKVARECRKINNFNACREIVGGLRTVSVSRLIHTWAKVDPKLNREFEELKELVAQKKNYKTMRSALSSCAPPCLPYVGITLQDLTFINEGNKDMLPNTNAKPTNLDPDSPAYKPELINFFKRQKIGVVIRALQQYQRTSYIFVCVPKLANKLQNMVVVSEDKLIELSLSAEPDDK